MRKSASAGERAMMVAAAAVQAQQNLQRAREWRDESEAAGVPALERLVKIARGYSGQSGHLRHFSLGLFNGPRWPFDMTRLRCLDLDLTADCLAVLKMDATPRVELHERIDNGKAIFLEFWRRERPEDFEDGR